MLTIAHLYSLMSSMLDNVQHVHVFKQLHTLDAGFARVKILMGTHMLVKNGTNITLGR